MSTNEYYAVVWPNGKIDLNTLEQTPKRAIIRYFSSASVEMAWKVLYSEGYRVRRVRVEVIEDQETNQPRS